MKLRIHKLSTKSYISFTDIYSLTQSVFSNTDKDYILIYKR